MSSFASSPRVTPGDAVLLLNEIREAGESFKVYRKRGHLHGVSERAAEMAYRRGFEQGVYMAFALVAGGGSLEDLCRYFERVSDWRIQGGTQEYTWAKQPPEDPLQAGDVAEQYLMQPRRRHRKLSPGLTRGGKAKEA